MDFQFEPFLVREHAVCNFSFLKLVEVCLGAQLMACLDECYIDTHKKNTVCRCCWVERSTCQLDPVSLLHRLNLFYPCSFSL